MNSLLQRKIVGSLKIFSIIIIVIFLIFSITFKSAVNDELEEDAVDDLKKDSVIIANEIDIYFTKYAEIVNQMLNSKIILDYILLSETDPMGVDNEIYGYALEKLKKIKAEDENLALVWLGLNKANAVISDDETWKPFEGFNLKERPWYKEMMDNEGKLTFSNPYHDASTDDIVVSIVAPIYYGERHVGNVGIDINIRDLSKYISGYAVGEGGYAFLLSDDKQYIVHPNSEIIMNKEALEKDKTSHNLMEQMILGQNEIIKYDLNGVPMYLTYAPVRINNWIVGSTVSQVQVMTFVNSFNGMAWGIIVLTVIMGFAFAATIKLSNNYAELNSLYSKLQTREAELKKSNHEISAAYQQLSASDEELQAQYDEIQRYSLKLEELKLKYDLAVELTNTSVWEINLEEETAEISHGYLKNANISYLDMWGVFKEFLDENNIPILKKALEDYSSGKTDEIYCQLEMYDGHKNKRWVLIQGRSDIYYGNMRTRLSGVIIDITKLKEQEIKIEELASIDPLTGIPNRRKFMGLLSKSLEEERSGAIILLDLDNFKEINDTMGHVYGDTVLNIVAKRLLGISNEDVVVSRFGGDEFLIEIKNVTEEADVKRYLSKIIDAFDSEIHVGAESIYLSMSMGVTLYPKDSSEVTELVMNADLAMYTVKETGKNNYAFYSDDMKTKIREKSRIERRLRRAIEKNDFKLVYQPQVLSNSGEICGYEALLRLKDESASPSEFIPIAEDTGLIVEIGRWVTEEAVKSLSVWKENNMNLKTVAINFSAKQLNDSKYVEFLSEILEKYDVSPSLLEIEITETILFDEKFETVQTLEKIKSLGISLSLDDFGKGYSSLNYLTYLPLDKIKLDKSLSDKFLYGDMSVINNIISLAHSLGFKVIAEGIETEEQFKKMCTTECNIIQGYYFSRPVESGDVETINDNIYKVCKINL